MSIKALTRAVHVHAIAPGERVLVADDLIATGGTAEAAVRLITGAGAKGVECCFVIELPDLGGRERLAALGCPIFTLCAFAGD
jgi:adenine phosphoribosyltransferase